MEPKRNIDKFVNDQAIVAELRRLPTPEVPEGLEDRLLAGIPPPASVKKRLSHWRVVAGLSVVAAAAVLFVVLSQFDHSMKDTGLSSANGKRNVVKAWPVLSLDPKETDPCNILPPLGDWR